MMKEGTTAERSLLDASPALDGLEQLESLEEKIIKTIDLLRATKAECTRLTRENARLQIQCEDREEAVLKLEGKLARLDKERDTVKVRLQRLLDQVDTLTSEGTAA